MQLQVSAKDFATTSTLEVADSVFSCKFNEGLVHQIVTAYMAAGRAGTKAQKTRCEVRGGGIKPWRQKGTGRARAGTIRSPLWRGGGVTFAAKPRDYSQKVNRKMYRGALTAILSELLRQNRLLVVEDFTVAQPKTKLLVEKLNKIGVKQALFITNELDNNLMLAVRNIPNVETCSVTEINPVVLLAFEKIVITVDALKKLEERLS